MHDNDRLDVVAGADNSCIHCCKCHRQQTEDFLILACQGMNACHHREKANCQQKAWEYPGNEWFGFEIFGVRV
jgi:transposase